MASLPVLPRIVLPRASRRPVQDRPAKLDPMRPADADLKLQAARRMQAQDRARAATSVAPPNFR
jgi:hypothetical protein